MDRRMVRPRIRGYTLIELLLCLFLLGVLYGLGGHAWDRLLSRYRLEGAVNSVATDFQLARMKAIAHNCSYRIRFYPQRSEYVLERESLGGSQPWPGLPEGTIRRFNDPGNPYYFPGVELVDSSNDPLFLPRGSVIGTTVTVRNAYGRRKIILSSLGRIRTEEG